MFELFARTALNKIRIYSNDYKERHAPFEKNGNNLSTVFLPGKPDSRRERKQVVLFYYNVVQLRGANSIYWEEGATR